MRKNGIKVEVLEAKLDKNEKYQKGETKNSCNVLRDFETAKVNLKINMTNSQGASKKEDMTFRAVNITSQWYLFSLDEAKKKDKKKDKKDKKVTKKTKKSYLTAK